MKIMRRAALLASITAVALPASAGASFNSGAGAPVDVQADASGNIFVLKNDNTVTKFSPSGDQLAHWGNQFDDAHAWSAGHLAVTDGLIYVLSRSGDDSAYGYQLDGQPDSIVTDPDAGFGGSSPSMVGYETSGSTHWLVDTARSIISDHPASTFSMSPNNAVPTATALSGDRLFVLATDDQIHEFDITGSSAVQTALIPAGPDARDIATDGTNLFVAKADGVHRLSLDGTENAKIYTNNVNAISLDNGTIYMVTSSGDVFADDTSDPATFAPPAPPVQAPQCTPADSSPAGVTINSGSRFTNDPHVTLTVNWPGCVFRVLVSNDGGFQVPGSWAPPLHSLSWTLDSSGPERLPKTVYARFDDAQTFADDIILDETPPGVTATMPAPTAGASTARVKRLTVNVRAVDRTSGVARIQFAKNKRHPFKASRYTRKVHIASARRLYVRATDRAGNVSAWHLVKIKKHRH